MPLRNVFICWPIFTSFYSEASFTFRIILIRKTKFIVVEDNFSMSSHCQNLFLCMKVIKVVKIIIYREKKEKKGRKKLPMQKSTLDLNFFFSL